MQTISSHPKPDSSSSIEGIKDYIRAHLHESLTSETVARKMYMSRNSFMQRFRRETGQTFHQFLTDERMKTAHRMLSEGHWSITFVAKKVGLGQTRFRALFRSQFQMTPSEFSKASKKDVQN